MIPVFFSLHPAEAARWRAAIDAAADAAKLALRETAEPAEAAYLLFEPNGPLRDFRGFLRARALFSLWAGADAALGFPAPPQNPPLLRMVEPGLSEGMRDYVVGHVLRQHLEMDRRADDGPELWAQGAARLARFRKVSVLGLGELGRACAQALAGLGFQVTGWSRGARAVDGVRCLHGADGLRRGLSDADILVLLLPATAETDSLMNAERLALLPRGAALINAGRGALIDDDALLAALDAGHVGHATLDVFRHEPLSPDHPYRAHPRVTVTPHIAAQTRPETAAPVVVEQIARIEAGLAPLHVVDRRRGY